MGVPNDFEAVILDLDGVITQTAKVHAQAWKRLFDEYLAYREAQGMAGFAAFEIEGDYAEHVDGKPRYDGVRDFLSSRDIQLPRGEPSDPPGFRTVYALGNWKDELFRGLIDTQGVEVYKDTVEQIRRWRQPGG